MPILLDTHALLWWLDGDARLSRRVRTLIEKADEEVLVSAATAWEIATKVRLGKLPGAGEVAENFLEMVATQGFRVLAISAEDALLAGSLDSNHRDPFDRMLAAQARRRRLQIASRDAALERLGAERLW